MPFALLDVSVTLPPWQNVVGPPGVITGVGGIGFTVTTVAADWRLMHPSPEPVTVYDPLTVAMYCCAVAPPIGVPSRYHCPLAELEVSVTLPPWQNVVGPPGVMVGVAGSGATNTLAGADGALLHPPLVTTTV